MNFTNVKLLAYLFLCVFWQLPVAAKTFVHDGVSYRSVPEICSKLGMSLSQADEGKKVTLRSKWSTIQIQGGSRIIEVNGTKVYLGYPVLIKNKSLHLPELDWQFTLKPILISPKTSAKNRSIKTIVIDPGHGGDDPGAQNQKKNLNEKDLTLSVAKYLQKRLKKQGFKVYLTRNNDRFIKLKDRPLFARKKNADLFLSIHFNASNNSSAKGIETYAYTLLNQPSTSRKIADAADKKFRRANRNDSFNLLLSYYIQKKLIDETGEVDRGVKRARFTVLETLHCPGSLVELGFVRNPETSKRLQNKSYLDTLASSLEESILEYQNRINQK